MDASITRSDTEEKDEPNVAAVNLTNEEKSLIKAFKDLNPTVRFLSLKSETDNRIGVTDIWDDSSIALILPEEDESRKDLLSFLSAAQMDKRLSAVYHTKEKKLEFLWTAFSPDPMSEQIIGRKFNYRYCEKDYKCHFSRSSDGILMIAKNFIEIRPSDTSYRNLTSFRAYAEASIDDNIPEDIFGEPTSFWIENIDLQQEELYKFLDKLNFYITYFDEFSPYVLVHPNTDQENVPFDRRRYRHDKFPDNIVAKDCDPQLLHFWNAAFVADASRKFLYSYRIIEHASYYYVDSMPKQAIRKVLMRPNLLDNIETASLQVIEAVRKSRVDDYHKMEGLLRVTVSTELLWKEISRNLEFFSQPTEFDGEFVIDALVTGKNSERDFLTNGIVSFAGTMRKIRNALSHGKEEKQASVILPTKLNYEKLRPWASLIFLAAGEVILYDQV